MTFVANCRDIFVPVPFPPSPFGFRRTTHSFTSISSTTCYCNTLARLPSKAAEPQPRVKALDRTAECLPRACAPTTQEPMRIFAFTTTVWTYQNLHFGWLSGKRVDLLQGRFLLRRASPKIESQPELCTSTHCHDMPARSWTLGRVEAMAPLLYFFHVYPSLMPPLAWLPPSLHDLSGTGDSQRDSGES